MPKVSVIIPTYNRAELLHLAITSVLNQTLQDFEVIVVDDNSQDHTREVVKSFNDKRIKYVCHERNKGVAAARNTGIFSSNGDCIAFLDDDDEWFSEKLQKQFDLLERCPSIVGAVYTGAFIVECSSRKIVDKASPKKRGYIFNTVLDQMKIAYTSTIFLRRQCFEAVGLFDENLEYGEDYDMWLRVSEKFQFEYINEYLINYAVHNDKQSLSNNYEVIIRSIDIQLKKYAFLFASNRKGHSRRYLALGEICCCTGNIRRGRGAFLKAIELHPLGVKGYYNLFLSLLGADSFKKFKEMKERISSRLCKHF